MYKESIGCKYFFQKTFWNISSWIYFYKINIICYNFFFADSKLTMQFYIRKFLNGIPIFHDILSFCCYLELMVPQSVSVKSFDKDTKKSSNSSFSFVESRVFKTDLEREVMRFSNKISSGAHKEVNYMYTKVNNLIRDCQIIKAF